MSTILSRVLYALYAAWRHRYLITIPMLTLPIIGLLVGLLSPKHYSSHTSLLIQETAKMNPFLEDFAISAMLKERMDGLKTLLHSRHILGLVAKERGLTDDKTSAFEYDEIIAELSSSLKVKKIGMDLIRIDYKSSQPDGMKETLQVISNHFIEQLLAPERSSMKDSSIFLAGHIGTRQKELSKAESEQRLAEREAEFAGATKSLGGLDLQLSKTNPVVGRIEEQIISIRSELALLRARYTQQHSKVQGAIRNLRRLEEERRHVLAETEHAINIEQLWDIASSARISSEKGTQPLLISQLQNFQMARTKVDSMSEEIISLKKMVSDLEKQTVDYGTHERELLELERKQSFKRQLYEDLLQRYEMARITGSLGLFEQGKRVKIIDRPYTPTAPSNLPLIIFIVAGFFAAIALSIGLTIILETCDTSIRRRDHLETITGVPVLSRIPPLRNLG